MYLVSSVMYDWQNLRAKRSASNLYLSQTSTLRQIPTMPASLGAARRAVLLYVSTVWLTHSPKRGTKTKAVLGIPTSAKVRLHL